MSYAVEETVQGILNLEDINQPEFADSIRQAAEGVINESIVLAHVIKGANKSDVVFKYRDLENREIDAVIINREAKSACLIEVKSKANIDRARVFKNEAKHLFDKEIPKNIGIDDSFIVLRVLAFGGKTERVDSHGNSLMLVNIEDLLMHYRDFWRFLDELYSSGKHIAI